MAIVPKARSGFLPIGRHESSVDCDLVPKKSYAGRGRLGKTGLLTGAESGAGLSCVSQLQSVDVDVVGSSRGTRITVTLIAMEFGRR